VPYLSDRELDRRLAASRPQVPAGLADAVLARAAAATPVAIGAERRRRTPWIVAAAALAIAAATLLVLLPRGGVEDDAWHVAGARLRPGATVVARAGEHVRLERRGRGALDLDGLAAAKLVDEHDIHLQRGRLRLEGRAEVTTPWARVVGTDADTLADIQLQEEDMIGAMKPIALAVAAGSVVTVAVVRGHVTVEKQPGAQTVALRAGERATLPEPERAVASAAEAVRSTPAAMTPAAPAAAPAAADGECPPETAASHCDEAEPPPDEPPVAVPSDGAPSMGPAGARVTIIEFSEYQCKFCERALSAVHTLAGMYPKDVRIVFKNFPLPGHKDARLAAEAALAAGEQSKFWEMHDILLANQEQLDRAALESYAQQLGLDMAKFRRALDDHRFAAVVEADFKDGVAAGIQGVPTFFINGRVVRGALPLEALKQIVDEELAKP
jgi:protein-disulfide isomerase